MRLLLLFLIACTAFLRAEPSWKNSITPYANARAVTPFTPEKLEFQLSWNGAINSGKMVIEFGKKDPRYPKVFLSQAYGRSTGAAYAIFPYSFTYTSFAKLSDHRPLVFIASEEDSKETVETKNTYKTPGVHFSSLTTVKKGARRIEEKHTFAASTVHDPITAMLAIRNQDLPNGKVIQLCAHPFGSPYLIKVSVLGREQHLGTSCIKLGIKMQKIDLDSGKLKSYKKLKSATMWISDDLQRTPVELRSKVFIGDVRASLVKRTPL